MGEDLICIEVTKRRGKIILEALKNKYVNISSDQRAVDYYEAYTDVKQQIESQC